MADCRPVEYKTNGTQYEAFIGRSFADDDRFTNRVPFKWLVVPEKTILRRNSNPTGSAVACWTPWTGILCFVLPDMT